MDDHVCDGRLGLVHGRLDLARERMRLGERPLGREGEREEDDEARIGAVEAQVARLLAAAGDLRDPT